MLCASQVKVLLTASLQDPVSSPTPTEELVTPGDRLCSQQAGFRAQGWPRLLRARSAPGFSLC